MAGLALTKIFTGMEKGPEAINTNDQALSGAIPRDSGWKQVSLQNATGSVFLRRVGSFVFFKGTIKPTIDSSLANAHPLMNIPTGFLPESGYDFFAVFAGGTGEPMRLQNGNGKSLNMIYTPQYAKESDFQAQIYWSTNDDFPA